MAIDEPKSPTEELNEPPLTTPMYVAWCDVMGASAMMKYSFRTARFRVFQFYTLVMATMQQVPGVSVYPAGDGVFLVSKDYEPIRDFLKDLMNRVCNVSQSKNQRQHGHLAFLVRSAIAHGAVSLGMQEAQRILQSTGVEPIPEVIHNVIVGPPVSVAYQLEREAPPLGIVLDISVLQRHTDILGPFVRWSKQPQQSLNYVKTYFEIQMKHKAEFGFDSTRVEKYLELAREYFNETLP